MNLWLLVVPYHLDGLVHKKGRYCKTLFILKNLLGRALPSKFILFTVSPRWHCDQGPTWLTVSSVWLSIVEIGVSSALIWRSQPVDIALSANYCHIWPSSWNRTLEFKNVVACVVPNLAVLLLNETAEMRTSLIENEVIHKNDPHLPSELQLTERSEIALHGHEA